MTSISCNIVLLPSDQLAQQAISLSAALQTHAAYFQLDAARGPFAHVSLYMTQCKIADLDAVQNVLAAIAADTPPIELTPQGYMQAFGYIDIDYAPSAALTSVQQRVLDAVNPLRDGLRPKDAARLAQATGVERHNLETYGYRGVGELFRPHITLTRFVTSEPIDPVTILPDATTVAHGQATALGLFEMGENGTCIRLIASFPLG